MDLKAYYDARVACTDRLDHLAQVGHTVNGMAIPEAHFQALLAQIETLLALNPADRLLDLCCGNGLFTRPLAARVASTCGADLSDAMIAVARTDHSAANLEYAVLDARDKAAIAALAQEPFTKALIYAAWQHFDTEGGRAVLEGLLPHLAPGVSILLGFVPDLARKWDFLDTPERRAAHAAHLAAGTDAMGTWWDRDTLSALCKDLGLTCTYSALPPQVHAAGYRFNALLARS